MNVAERAAAHNTRLATEMRDALAEKGYAVTYAGRGEKNHAAITTRMGHSGFRWPRSLCQANTSAFYHALTNQDAEVTCKRCLAGLDKRGIY
jgi:hypothetical protein